MIDKVVDVKRLSERLMCLIMKVLLDECMVNHTSHFGRSEDEKDVF